MKTIELFCTVGCYINEHSYKVVLTYDETMWTDEQAKNSLTEVWLYPEAVEMTESAYGSHGFELDYDDVDEEDVVQYIEEHAEYGCVDWVEDEHAGACTYGHSSEPEVVHITL